MSFLCNVSYSFFMSSQKTSKFFNIEFVPSKCHFSSLPMEAGYRISVTPIAMYYSVLFSAGIFLIVSLNTSLLELLAQDPF